MFRSWWVVEVSSVRVGLYAGKGPRRAGCRNAPLVGRKTGQRPKITPLMAGFDPFFAPVAAPVSSTTLSGTACHRVSFSTSLSWSWYRLEQALQRCFGHSAPQRRPSLDAVGVLHRLKFDPPSQCPASGPKHATTPQIPPAGRRVCPNTGPPAKRGRRPPPVTPASAPPPQTTASVPGTASGKTRSARRSPGPRRRRAGPNPGAAPCVRWLRRCR